MTDTKALIDSIKKSKKHFYEVSHELGMSEYSLRKKVNNITEFKSSEIAKLSRVLSLTSNERDKIFFAEDVENKSTTAY